METFKSGIYKIINKIMAKLRKFVKLKSKKKNRKMLLKTTIIHAQKKPMLHKKSLILLRV